jgi:hypothetical protein
MTVFRDPLGRLVDDPEHSKEEEGLVIFGRSEAGRLLAVMHTARSEVLRITVYDILGYLASGMSEAEILENFPDLEPGDIRASLAVAADFERRLTAVPSL